MKLSPMVALRVNELKFDPTSANTDFVFTHNLVNKHPRHMCVYDINSHSVNPIENRCAMNESLSLILIRIK